MKKYITAIFTCFILSSCAIPVTKTVQATGGSKSDGIIELSYSFRRFEKPIVDWGNALSTAKERCSAWGYKNAESLGGQKNSCQAYDGYGCIEMLVTVNYQCID